jgi:DNA-binding transcriptional LysR family regulator
MEANLSVHNPISTITLRQLQYFVAVAEAEHFTRASERLLIAQPSLSRHVKELEEALGVELFIRDARGVRLTEAGRELLNRAQATLAMLAGAVVAVRSIALGQRRRLRLGYYGPCFHNNPVTRSALERFRAEMPDVDVHSQELFSEQMVQALRDDRVDIAVSRDIVPTSGIEAELIVTERLVALLADSDELTAKPAVTFADLSGRGLIALQMDLAFGFYRRVVETARDANAQLSIVQEVTQLPSIGYHVSRNEGIAILPASAAAIPLPGVVAREISDPRATTNILALTRRGENSPVASRFMELLGITKARAR